MEQYFRNVIEQGEKGLYLVELPTGFGKSHGICHAIADILKEATIDRKVVFLTTMKKNLPESELLSALDLDEDFYHANVLRCYSYFDDVLEKFDTLSVPASMQNELYIKLHAKISKYKKDKANNLDKGYLEQQENEIRELEGRFRYSLKQALSNAFPSSKEQPNTKSAKLNAIRTDREWSWVAELYPGVFADNYPVLMMSVSKFLTKHDPIVENRYSFLNAPWLQNAIVFIDEFDATKATIRDAIIENALTTSDEYLSVFRRIYHGLNEQHLSRQLYTALQNVDAKVYQAIKKDAAEIAEKYFVDLSFKAVADAEDKKQHFLFHDLSYHMIASGPAKKQTNHGKKKSPENKRFVRGYRNRDNNRVEIYFETSEKYFAHQKGEDDVHVYGMLRSIDSFFRRFRLFVYQWGTHYMNVVNASRSAQDDEFVLENALKSILQKFELSHEAQDMLLHEIAEHVSSRRAGELLPDSSFYQRGMEVFELRDDDSHNDNTDLTYISISDTPEKLLLSLCDKVPVVGVSATATYPTVIGNYDLVYLQDVLKDRYHTLPSEKKDQVANQLYSTWERYRTGDVKVHSSMIPFYGSNDEDFREIACRLFKDIPSYGLDCLCRIESKTETSYHIGRYLNIVQVMLEFWANDIKAFLYLGPALPSKDNPDFDIGLLAQLFSLTFQYENSRRGRTLDELKMDKPFFEENHFLAVLRSGNFVEDKRDYLSQLEQGKRVFLMSSYSTLSAGQNMQYLAPDKDKLIELIPDKHDGDKRHIMTDFPALYLACPTNLTVNTYPGEKITQKNLLNMLFQIEGLLQGSELSFQESRRMVKLGFDAYTYNDREYQRNQLYDTKSIRLQANILAVQGVGRICRTYLKSPDIYLFIDQKLLDMLDIEELQKHILPPEMHSLMALRANLGRDYSSDEENILRTAENVSRSGMWIIRQLLFHDWDEESMYLWNMMREFVLCHPTASKEIWRAEELAHKLYITSGKALNHYLYTQYSDFGEVLIDFNNDPIAFKNSRRYPKFDGLELPIYSVNIEDSGLIPALRFPGMKQFFEENGYATTFEPDQYIMSPVMYHNIYKGALGEVCGRYILQQALGMVLNPITDPGHFEFFDFELSPGVYVDFKNWKFSYQVDRESVKKKIEQKLDAIGGKRVYVINLIGNPNVYTATSQKDGRIIEIPGLIDEDGNLIMSSIKAIKEEDVYGYH